MKRTRTDLFVWAWVTIGSAAGIALVGGMNMAGITGVHSILFLLFVAEVIATLGATVVLLLSYRPELLRLRKVSQKIFQYLSDWDGPSHLQMVIDRRLTGMALRINDAKERRQTLANQGTSGLTLTYMVGKSEDQLPDALKEALEECGENVRFLITRFYATYDEISLFAKEAGIKLRYRAWEQYLPVPEKDEQKAS